jgi:outer membrane lipoprotein SlyB
VKTRMFKVVTVMVMGLGLVSCANTQKATGDVDNARNPAHERAVKNNAKPGGVY